MAESTLAARLKAEKPEERIALLQQRHPLYNERRTSWQLLLDAYEGAGGFLSGAYLWKFPRELSDEFTSRCEQARYHNYARALVNLYVRHLFHQGINRQTTDDRLKAWWANADGRQTELTTLLRRAAALALVSGQQGLLIDKTRETPTGPTRAEDPTMPFLRLYSPVTVLDWRLDRDEVVALKLAEDPPTADIFDATGEDEPQYLIWTREEWARFGADGGLLEENVHRLGLVPFVMLRADPSVMTSFLGQSILGNANLFRALYNRTSEEDLVLRSSAFSVLTISVPPDGDVEKTRTQLGSDIGPLRAIIAQGDVAYVTPDQQVAGTIRQNVGFLVQEIYRLAHVGYQRDSREAESAEAIRLKHSELNEMLVGLAAELEAVERRLAQLFFAWVEPTPSAADAAWQAAEVSVAYPREFFVADLAQELENWARAVALRLGATMTRRIKRKAVRLIEPDLPLDVQTAIDTEIDALPDDAALAPEPPEAGLLRQIQVMRAAEAMAEAEEEAVA